MMSKITKEAKKVSTHFKDLVMERIIGLMLMDKMPFGTIQISRTGLLEV